MNKTVKAVFTAALTLCLVFSCFAPALGAERTYRISNVSDLLKLAENCILDTYSKELNVELTADIDLTDAEFNGIPTFSGSFNGNGHTVSGLSMTVEGSVVGFFRYLEQGAVVRDLNVTGEIAPEGSRNTVGGIAGSNSGTIENCSFEGSLAGADDIGGIAGENKLTGIITDCTVKGAVTGNHFVGGIAGENYGVIRSCRNDAEINTTAAQNEVELSDISLKTLTSSEAANTVTDVGGIAGTSSGVIRDCENRGTTGYRLMGYNVGGIAGSQSGYISGCSNYGSVYGRKEVGGIVGHMEPVTTVEYTEDTLQILEGQVGTLGALTNRASANAQSNASQITGQIAVLESQAQTAREALDILTPEPGEEMPDADTVLAAQNNLTESITAMPGTLDGIASAVGNTVSGVSRDLQAVSNQVNLMGETIGTASEDLGFTVTDISDSDTESDYLGKVEKCFNYGDILGDGNVGGIAGAIAYENDLDPDEDVDVYGNMSLNFSGEIRAVIRDCDNKGTVTVKKQNGGGIVGWQSLGLVRDCLNTGEVSGENADYVGGVAGSQNGFLRQCSAKCVVTGKSYTGGIAGSGEVITDCRSMVRLSANEKYGLVLGYAEEKPDVNDEEGRIKGNYYLVVDSDMGAVDGISYDGCAQSIDQDKFFSLASLDPVFRTVSIRFVFEDGTSKIVRITPGRALSNDKIPAIPEKDGCSAYWDGLGEIDITNVRFDGVVYAKYNERTSVFESDEKVGELPLILVQGEFNDKHGIVLEKTESTEEGFVTGYSFTVTGGTAKKLRCYIGEGFEKSVLNVTVTDKSGTARVVPAKVEGSYVTFEISEGDSSFAVVLQAKSYTLEIAIGAGAIVIIVLIIILAARKNRKAEE
ncbi:MAG: hypothetical protein IJ017_06320 [Oscillospiraceae bacterium]|nr:hypothetical protein [Oscillospiraceae bacterium]